MIIWVDRSKRKKPMIVLKLSCGLLSDRHMRRTIDPNEEALSCTSGGGQPHNVRRVGASLGRKIVRYIPAMPPCDPANCG